MLAVKVEDVIVGRRLLDSARASLNYGFGFIMIHTMQFLLSGTNRLIIVFCPSYFLKDSWPVGFCKTGQLRV